MLGVHGKERVVGEHMAMMIAFAMQLHVELGVPREPQGSVGVSELYRSVVDDEVVAGKFEVRERLAEIGLNVQEVVGVGGNPDAAAQRNGKISDCKRGVIVGLPPGTLGFTVSPSGCM